MKLIQALHDRTVFIGELEDCISVCTLGQETAFLDAEQVEELIEVLQDRLKEMKSPCKYQVSTTQVKEDV